MLASTDPAGSDVALGLSPLLWTVPLRIRLLPLDVSDLAGRVVRSDVRVVLESVGPFPVPPLLLAELVERVWRGRIGPEPIGGRLPRGRLGTVTLVLGIAAMLASQGRVLFGNPGVVAWMIPPGLVFFAAISAVAPAAARLALDCPETPLLAMTTAARNVEASLAVAVGAFTSPLVALTVVIGPAFELPVLVAMVQLLKRIRARGWFPEPEHGPKREPVGEAVAATLR